MLEIQVKRADAATTWIWGAFRMPGRILHELAALWRARGERDAFISSLVNAFLAAGGEAVGVRAGAHYVDVGTINGYRAALDCSARWRLRLPPGPTGSRARSS